MRESRAAHISAELALRVDQIVPSLLPAARRNGAYWSCGSADGEPGNSLFVIRHGARAGRWKDAANDDGHFHDMLDLIQAARRCDISEAMRWAEDVIGMAKVGMAPRPRPTRQAPQTHDMPVELTDDDRQRVQAAHHLWSLAKPAKGTLAETYLRHRGIMLPVPPSIRFLPSLRYDDTLSAPCLVAAIQAPDRTVTAVQRIWLAPDGRGKAAVETPKKTLGHMGSGAVRLARCGATLGIAEGIETALSAMQMFSLPVWAVLGCGRLGALYPAETVERVIIFADNDKPALDAAEKAIVHYRALGLDVMVEPPDGHKDWNDALRARNSGRRAA